MTIPLRLLLATLVLGLGIFVAVPKRGVKKPPAAPPRSIPSAPVVHPPPRASRLSAGPFPGSVLVADVNRDGRPDLLVALVLADGVAVYLGDGKEGFAKSAGSPFPAGRNPNDLAQGDFDGNGTPDLAFANHDAPFLTVLLGDGRGAFHPAPGSPFTTQSRPHTHGVAAADFDGDHKLDLATESWANNKVEVLFGDGHGRFAIPGPLFPLGAMPYQRLRAADLNGDGRSDLVTTDFEGASVSVLLADGKRGLHEAPGAPFPAGDSPFSVAIGDLDGDRLPDLAVANYSGHLGDTSRDGVNVLIGDGKGRFRRLPGSPFPVGRAPVAIAVGDLDGDGKDEVATANFASNDVSILKGNSAGRFAIARTLPAGREPEGLTIADLNGDGKAELVVTSSIENRVTIYWGPILGK